MAMELKKVYEAVDEIAPFALSRELIGNGFYDNSGILIDCGEAEGALFALDLTRSAIAEAKARGANLIITHHPAIYEPLKALVPPQAETVLACVRAGISVISAHLNLDAAPGGIDESLMRALGGSEAIDVMQRLSGGGYGRVYEVPACDFPEFGARVREKLNSRRIVTYGGAPVRRVASFCGAGLDEDALAFALSHNADTVVSSDGKHHLITAAAESGLNLMLIPHYTAEIYGFERFYERLSGVLPIPCFFFEDSRLR